MKQRTTATEAKAFSPEAFDEIIEAYKKRFTKSKKPKSLIGATLDDIQWSFNWCVQVKGCSIDEMLQEAQNPKPRPTVEERLKESLEGHMVSIVGEIGHVFESSDAGISQGRVPDFIEDNLRAQFEEDDREFQRYNNLTPEERQKELLELISDPSLDGLMCLKIKKDED